MSGRVDASENAHRGAVNGTCACKQAQLPLEQGVENRGLSDGCCDNWGATHSTERHAHPSTARFFCGKNEFSPTATPERREA